MHLEWTSILLKVARYYMFACDCKFLHLFNVYSANVCKLWRTNKDDFTSLKSLLKNWKVSFFNLSLFGIFIESFKLFWFGCFQSFWSIKRLNFSTSPDRIDNSSNDSQREWYPEYEFPLCMRRLKWENSFESFYKTTNSPP